MKTAALHVTKFPSAGPQSSTMSPFMKSSNSEYGNWFQRGPPSPFALNAGLAAPSPVLNFGSRKLSVRRTPSYLQGDAGSQGLSKLYQNDRSFISPLNTKAGARTDSSLNQTIPSLHLRHSSNRTGPGPLERSQSYSNEVSPRGGYANASDSADSYLARKGTLERSSTAFDLGNSNTNSHEYDKTQGVGLRRSRTFTEGTANPSWKSSSPRSSYPTHTNGQAASVPNSDTYTNSLDRSDFILPTVGPTNSGNASNLPQVQQQPNVSDHKSYAISPGYTRSSLYMFGQRERNKELSSAFAPLESDTSWMNSSSSRDSRPPSANPYTMNDTPLKSYDHYSEDKRDSPRNSSYGTDGLAGYLRATQSSFDNPSQHGPSDVSFPSSKSFPSKAVKSILKKKSAYEVSNNYLSFSRSLEDSSLSRGWAGYSNPSAFSSVSKQQYNGMPSQNELLSGSMSGKQRLSSKKVTFSV